MKVLIVEDDAAVRTLVMLAAKGAGHETRLQFDGLEFLEKGNRVRLLKKTAARA